MRPINLIPVEIKRRRVRRDTGIAPYVVTAVAALLVAGVFGYVLMHNQVTSKKNEAAELSAEVKQAEAEAAAMAGYGKFAVMKQARLAGLTMIAQSRFPWGDVIKDISKAIPSNAWLIEITGMAAKGANVGTESGGESTAQGSGEDIEIDVPGPTVQLIGCSYKQSDVAKTMTRLRNISGVRQVLLKESKEKIKGEKGSSASSADQEEECRTRFGIHKFEITLTFSPGPATAVIEAKAAAAKAAAQPPTTEETKEAESKKSEEGSSDTPAPQPTKAATQ